ncbi:MAG TPA: hypothetical protein VF399_12035 [bacterium]
MNKDDVKKLAYSIWDSKLPVNYKMELFGGLKKLYDTWDQYSDQGRREVVQLVKDRLEWIKTHDPQVIITQLIFDLIDIILKPISFGLWLLRHIKEVVLFVVVAALIAGGAYYGIKLRKVVKK